MPGMSEDRKFIWLWIVALLVGLPVLYVGAYAWTVERSPVYSLGPIDFSDGPYVFSLAPCYCVRSPLGVLHISGGEAGWGRGFAPVHSIDRRLRSSYWTLTLDPQ
jgi:hypothetical protein